jgi:Mrp family chromosome partitioning ATPase
MAIPEPEAQPITRTLHARLQGRYIWAVLLALVGGIAGGVLAYRQGRPLYETTAQLRIQAVTPRILYSTDLTGMMPMYEQYFNTQMHVISSKRVLSLASEQADWRALGHGALSAKDLVVENPSGTDLIELTYSDPTPDGALAGARSVLEAYLQVYHEQEKAEEDVRLRVLIERRENLYHELGDINNQVMAIANNYGTDSLEPMRDANFKRLDRVEDMLKNIEGMIVVGEPGKTGESVVENARALTVKEIAEVDPQMRLYVSEKEELERSIEMLRGRYGSEYLAVRQAAQRLEGIEQGIEKYARQFRDSQPPDAIRRPWEAEGVPAVVSLAQLRERQKRLQKLFDSDQTEAIKLGQDELRLRKFQLQAKEVQERLDETRTRIEQLNVEATAAGRVFIVTSGELPTKPTKDSRIKMAAMAGGGGAMIGFALVALLAMLDRRLHRPEHLDGIKQVPILGILPELPEDLSDPAQAGIAAHCVHQMRGRLQLRAGGSPQQIYAITSAGALDGKTSLAMALALSFAGTRARTLLIDLDLVGGGLTTRLEPMFRPRLGEILQRRGLITTAQLEQGLKPDAPARKMLGAALVDLGFVRESDVAQALANQAKPQPGLSDVMGGRPLESSVVATRVPYLSVLQLGSANPDDVAHISSSFVRQLLDQARERFEVVIVDTGPILGSLEASLVAPQADGVVMVVARGTPRALATAAATQLRSLNAPLAGIAFNRARTGDLHSYSYAPRSSRAAGSRIQPQVVSPSLVERSPLGPVAMAMVQGAGIPLSQERVNGGGKSHQGQQGS